ncbi:MAG: alginate export family protein [Planctomycetota bacterium]
MPSLLRPLCCAATIAVVCAPAFAQNQQRRIERAVRTAEGPDSRLQIDPSLAFGERSVIDVGGFTSLTGVWLDDSSGNSRRLFQPELTLYGRAIVDGAHTFFARARAQYRSYSEDDSFDGRGDRWEEPVIDRYWYEFDLASAIAARSGVRKDWNVNVRVGRQFVDWGAGLALSEQLFAVKPTFTYKGLSLEGLAGITPPDEAITDFDASRDDFDEETERSFFGGTLRYTFPSAHQIYAYVLHMGDQNSGDRPRANIVPEPVEFEYDATYLGIGSSGTIGPDLRYVGEFVYQFGESTSDPLRTAQTEEDISAWAARGQLQWFLRDDWLTRFEFEVLLASGDDDRLTTTDTVGGNLSGTDDNAFNSLGFVNTGLAFAPALSNIALVRAGAATFPFRELDGFERFQVGADVLLHHKLDADAPIEEPTTDDAYLGIETDFFVNWRVTSDLSLVARYGVFFPGDAIASETEARHFVFLGATLNF